MSEKNQLFDFFNLFPRFFWIYFISLLWQLYVIIWRLFRPSYVIPRQGFICLANKFLSLQLKLLLRRKAYTANRRCLKHSLKVILHKSKTNISNKSRVIGIYVMSSRQNMIGSSCNFITCKCIQFDVIRVGETNQFVCDDLRLNGLPSFTTDRHCQCYHSIFVYFIQIFAYFFSTKSLSCYVVCVMFLFIEITGTIGPKTLSFNCRKLIKYLTSIFQLTKKLSKFIKAIKQAKQLNIQNMANQSVKKNEQSIRSTITIMNILIYGLIVWFVGLHLFFLISQTVSIWKIIVCVLLSGLSHFCLKQTIKCWELQLPAEAAQYYIDVLAMNGIVMALSPFTDYAWHIYWLILIFIGWIGVKYLWQYITPKYQEPEETDDDKKGKKQKKQKRQKVKYIKH